MMQILIVEDDSCRVSKIVTLRQSWFDTPATTGSYIHVCGEFTAHGECTIDDSHGLIILHPDHLISVTVVADSVGCARRAVLQDRIKATSSASAPQLYGHILHEVFQEALKANKWDDVWLDTAINMLLPRYYESMLELELSVATVVNDIKSKLPQLQAWGEVFVSAKPSVCRLLSNSCLTFEADAPFRIVLTSMIEVESKLS
jgi:DNA replication ATP-dependent helicase Dna2